LEKSTFWGNKLILRIIGFLIKLQIQQIMNWKHQIYSKSQTTMLTILRMLIGWHFLYEGVVKLWNPGWTAAGYLNDSGGSLASFFKWMASSPGLLNVVDSLNVWGLILIGLSLILGLFSRAGILAGIVLLAFYYLSHPPVIGADYALPSEGSYLWVNKNLLELFSLAVLFVFPTSRIIGMDRLIYGPREEENLTISPKLEKNIQKEEAVSIS
jgi:thiosulfate dehydrogenase [quinone] large subunit